VNTKSRFDDLTIGCQTAEEAAYNTGRLWEQFAWHLKQEFLLKAVGETSTYADRHLLFVDESQPTYYFKVFESASDFVRRQSRKEQKLRMATFSRLRNCILAGLLSTADACSLLDRISQIVTNIAKPLSIPKPLKKHRNLVQDAMSNNYGSFYRQFDNIVDTYQRDKSGSVGATAFVDEWITKPIYHHGLQRLLTSIVADCKHAFLVGLAVQKLVCPHDICDKMQVDSHGRNWMSTIKRLDGCTDRQIRLACNWINSHAKNPFKIACFRLEVGAVPIAEQDFNDLVEILRTSSLSEVLPTKQEFLWRIDERFQFVLLLHNALTNRFAGPTTTRKPILEPHQQTPFQPETALALSENAARSIPQLAPTPALHCKVEKKLTPAGFKALSYYEIAQKNSENTLTDQQAYDFLKTKQDDGSLSELISDPQLNGYKLPEFDTWSRYVRIARKALDRNKNTMRKGRETGKSVVREDEI